MLVRVKPRGGARGPRAHRDHCVTGNDEAQPSPARRSHLRVLGNPDRLHHHRPLRLHRSLEPPRSRRGHNQAKGAAHTLHCPLHLSTSSPHPPLRHPSSFAISTSSSTFSFTPACPVFPPLQIWGEVYGSGRHFIGVGKRFHTFPMDYRLVDFSWMTMADSYGDTFYDAPSLVGRTPQAPAPPPAPARAPHAPATRHTPHVKRRTPHGQPLNERRHGRRPRRLDGDHGLRPDTAGAPA